MKNCQDGREDVTPADVIHGKKLNKEVSSMIRKKIIVPHRVRSVSGSFAFIPHRLLADGFLACMTGNELLLYFFLVMASDSKGLSYYSSRKICALLKLSFAEFIDARDRLIARDLIAVDDMFFQVLELPGQPIRYLPEKCC
jgi:hypothetical protein